jgi:hypothetical protein
MRRSKKSRWGRIRIKCQLAWKKPGLNVAVGIGFK